MKLIVMKKPHDLVIIILHLPLSKILFDKYFFIPSLKFDLLFFTFAPLLLTRRRQRPGGGRDAESRLPLNLNPPPFGAAAPEGNGGDEVL